MQTCSVRTIGLPARSPHGRLPALDGRSIAAEELKCESIMRALARRGECSSHQFELQIAAACHFEPQQRQQQTAAERKQRKLEQKHGD